MTEFFLDADRIRAVTFANYVEIHQTLGSTNDRAKELAQESNIELPAIVVARHQTAGRGRGQNLWWSADGALTFSLLLEPNTAGICSIQWPQLSLAIAVAVCDALALEWDPLVKNGNSRPAVFSIKWPNDVLLEGKKVCGILIESPGGAGFSRNRVVIGIGINVNNRVDQLAVGHPLGSTLPNRDAVALCEVSNHTHDLQKLLESLVQALETRMKQLASQDPHLPRTWQHLDWLAKRNVAAYANGQWVNGFCLGMDVDGALLIESDSGRPRLYSGSVRAT